MSRPGDFTAKPSTDTFAPSRESVTAALLRRYGWAVICDVLDRAQEKTDG